MGRSPLEIGIFIIIGLFVFAGADCTAGYCMNKFQVKYGKVVDKKHEVMTDDDGDRTHYYTLTVDIDSGNVDCNASENLYNSIMVGDGCKVYKKVGFTGLGYGYAAQCKAILKAEQ